MGPRLILRLHLAVKTVLLLHNFIFLVLLMLLEFVIKRDIIVKLVLVVFKERMLDDARKRHSALAIYHEKSFKKVLEFFHLFLELLFLGESQFETEVRSRAAPSNLCLHVMT